MTPEELKTKRIALSERELAHRRKYVADIRAMRNLIRDPSKRRQWLDARRRAHKDFVMSMQVEKPARDEIARAVIERRGGRGIRNA